MGLNVVDVLESDEDVEEMEERVPSPEVTQEEAATFYEQTPW